jgi:hypothetical protein
MDMLREARTGARVVPLSIHGGAQVKVIPGGGFSVPKRDLAGVLQLLLGHRQLTVAPGLPLASALVKEMGTFTVKVNVATGAESFEAWRERDNDDLVLSVAMGVWWRERGVVARVVPL